MPDQPSHCAPPPYGRQNHSSLSVQTIRASPGNRRLNDGVFKVDLQKPWSDIARAGRRDGAEGAGEASGTIWLAVLEKARTFFDENSDAD